MFILIVLSSGYVRRRYDAAPFLFKFSSQSTNRVHSMGSGTLLTVNCSPWTCGCSQIVGLWRSVCELKRSEGADRIWSGLHWFNHQRLLSKFLYPMHGNALCTPFSMQSANLKIPSLFHWFSIYFVHHFVVCFVGDHSVCHILRCFVPFCWSICVLCVFPLSLSSGRWHVFHHLRHCAPLCSASVVGITGLTVRYDDKLTMIFYIKPMGLLSVHIRSREDDGWQMKKGRTSRHDMPCHVIWLMSCGGVYFIYVLCGDLWAVWRCTYCRCAPLCVYLWMFVVFQVYNVSSPIC